MVIGNILHGSGFIVDKQGTVLTCRHSLEVARVARGSSITLLLQGHSSGRSLQERQITAVVEEVRSDLDLARLRIQEPLPALASPLPLGETSPLVSGFERLERLRVEAWSRLEDFKLESLPERARGCLLLGLGVWVVAVGGRFNSL